MRSILLALFLVLALATGHTFSKVNPSLEELKVAFVYNFLKFVSWPSQGTTLRFCIVGETPLVDYLEVFSGKSVSNKVIMVTKTDPKDTKDCQAIFIGKLAPLQKEKLLKTLKGKAVLTISDQKSFTKEGGIIELFLEGKKLRFKVNYTAAKEAGLKISSRLLRLAKEVI